MMGSDICKGERFQVGEIWKSPRGFFYKVVEVIGSQATLRMGCDGSGRKARRWVDAIDGWSIYKREE
nr:hypothetical protein [Citrobacter freundii]